MKKSLIYIGWAILALAFAACRPQEMAVPVNTLPDDPGEGKVNIDLTLSLSDAVPGTRALGEGASIHNIYVAVFGSSHYLNEFVQAIPYVETGGAKKVSVDANGELDYVPTNGVYPVRITLTKSDSPRYVHIMANVNVEGDHFPQFNTYEDELMPSFEAIDTDQDGEDDGYWQYLAFMAGIDENAQGSFDHVELIRDYARVEVDVQAAGWTLKAYEVYNTPVRGLFPIIHGITSEGLYQYCDKYIEDDFGTNVSFTKGFVDAETGGFSDEVRTRLDRIEQSSTIDVENTLQPKYVFENPLYDDDDAAFVIVRMRESGASADKYFRLDIRTPEDEGLPLLRNYRYRIVVSSVSPDCHGYDTPYEASLNRSRLNAFSGMDVSKLTELDNGLSKLNVEYVTRIFTSRQTASLKYRYLEGSTDKPADVGLPGGTAIKVHGSEADWEAGGSLSGDSNLPYELEYDVVNLPSSGYDLSTFEVVGKNGDGSFLKQTVRIIAFAKKSLVHTWESDPDDDYTFTLGVTLPEGLPEEIFPFQLELFQQDNQMAVLGEGTDLEVKSDGSFHYYQTVSYADYLNQQTNPIQFKIKTLTLLSEAQKSATVFSLLDRRDDGHDPYFDEKEIDFKGVVHNLLAENLVVRNTSGTASPLNLGLLKPVTATFDYLRTDNDPVTVTLVGLEPVPGDQLGSGILTPVDGQEGVYSFTPTGSSVPRSFTFHLRTTTRFTACSVELSQGSRVPLYSGSVARNPVLVIRGYNGSGYNQGGILRNTSNPAPYSFNTFASVFNGYDYDETEGIYSFPRTKYYIYDPTNTTTPSGSGILGTGTGIVNPSYQHTRFRTSNNEAHPFTNHDELRVVLSNYGDRVEEGRIFILYNGSMSTGDSGLYVSSAKLADIQDCIDAIASSGQAQYVPLAWYTTMQQEWLQ